MEKVFKITGKELDKLKEWQEKIKDLFGEYGTYKYTFTPTGIGTCVEVYSDLTRTTIDLTDIDSW